MKFSIYITVDRKMTALKAERIYESKDLEHFKVEAFNKSLVLQSNKLLLNARGLKNKKD